MDSSKSANFLTKRISDSVKTQIITAYETGFKPSVISYMLNMKTYTVYRIIKNYKNTWQVEAKKREGNDAKLLTNQAVCSIRRWIEEDRTITLHALEEKFFEKYGVRTDISTIAKEVEEFNRSLKQRQKEPETRLETTQICRFCLNRDEEPLAPVASILDSNLTIENVERFTGVSITSKKHSMYAVCSNCTNILQNSVLFRLSCIRNDAYLREQFQWDGTTPGANNLNPCDEQDPLALDNNYTVLKIYEPATTVQCCDSQPILQTTNKPKPVKVMEEFESASYIEPITIENSDYQSPLNTVNKSEKVDVKEEISTTNYIEPGTAPDFIDSQPTLNATNNLEPVNVLDNHIESDEPTCSENEEYESDEINDALTDQASETNISIFKNGVHLCNIPAYEEHKMLCNICGIFVQNITSHMLTHTHEAKYACPHCPIKMTHSSNLTRHINAVHLKLVIKTCEICGKGFTHRCGIRSHMRSEHGLGKMYECNVCLKKYSHPSGLREHKRTHSMPQYHKCEICGKGFLKRMSLRVHQRVHSSEKPFACSGCPKSFKSSYARNTHQLTHRGILFKCTICDKSYRYKSVLNIHLRTMHSNNEDGRE